MNLLTFQTSEDLNQAACSTVVSLVQSKPSAVLGLATGSTPIGIYEKIVEAHQKGAVRFGHVTTFNLDEYVGLPKSHSQSYITYMKTHLFDQIDLPLEQVHIPNGNAENLQQECRRYDLLLEKHPIDLQLLGLGHNGHIGFNEPAHALIGGTHVVDLQEQTRAANARFFSSLDEVPKKAITMGVGSILKSDTILLVVRGAEKAEIVHRALTGPISTEVPASLLQTHPKLIVMLDHEAGRYFHE